MKFATSLRVLVIGIGALALWAALAGLFDPTPGEPFAYTNHRGENVVINGHGLYFYDTVSSAAQMQGNDFVTLVVGLPLLAASSILTFRGSLRGRLLCASTSCQVPFLAANFANDANGVDRCGLRLCRRH